MNKKGKIEHELFDVGILLKSIHALIEIIGGALAYFINSDFILRITIKMTQGELLENPNDFFAKNILNLAYNFSSNTKQFVTLYLLSHGIINLILVIGLFKKKMWAYHTSFVVFTIFVVYQIYRYIYHPSIFLIMLTIFDLFIIWLVWKEYERIKNR